MACSNGCRTQDHSTFGECMRAKSFRVGWSNSAAGKDLTAQRKWDSRLQEYRAARKQGIQPESSKLKDIRHAVDESNRTGVAYMGASG